MSLEALSASKIERVANCTASAILPSYPHTGKLAIAGTERHANLEEDRPAEEKDGAFDPRSLDLPNPEREVAYLIDPKTRSVKRIGAGMPRKYGVDRPWYTVGTTLDLESVDHRECHGINVAIGATAVDWKSRKRVTAAKRNWQVRLQALALYTVFQVPVRSGLVYLDNGEQDFHDFTRFDHAATWADLDTVIASLEGAVGKEPRPHMGPWCSYCEAITSCPAISNTIANLISEIPPIHDFTDEQVEDIYHKLKAVKDRYDKGWQGLRARVAAKPVVMESGRKLVMVEDRRGTRTLTEVRQDG